jgi:hypothetical protein
MVPEIVAADMLHIETRRRRPLEVADRFCMRPLAAILVYLTVDLSRTCTC